MTWVEPPKSSSYVIKNCRVPNVLLSFHKNSDEHSQKKKKKKNIVIDRDGLSTVNITILNGLISSIDPPEKEQEEEEVVTTSTDDEKKKKSDDDDGGVILDLKNGICFPTFADLHTHIDKGHTCERSRNESGSLAGADESCQRDGEHWTEEELIKRMEFSLKTAYAHGTSIVRTHLMSGPIQGLLTWPVFVKLREKWKGKVELQGVSLSILSFFRDREASRELARQVKECKGILGAAVSCSDYGGTDLDPHTTCGNDLHKLLDIIFQLAKEFELNLDFHVDENGNEESKGLMHIANAAIRNDYKGNIVCGHCCSLAVQTTENLELMLQTAKKASITIVSLPLVNQWLQNRCEVGEKTPRRRGVPLLKEIANRKIPICLASDNIRDQFYGYGDLDMLEVFRLSVFIAHLDRPSFGDWPKAVTSTPARAMGFGETHGLIREGGEANLVLFKARHYSELFSRPQHDRLVLRHGKHIGVSIPGYEELDEI
mgnify:FL=1